MFQIWHDYIKEKYNKKAQLCYIDPNSFIMHMKIKYFCKDIGKQLYNTYKN